MQAKLSVTSGLLLMVAFVLAVAGGIMYAGRNQLDWSAGQTRAYYVSERLLWIGGTACWPWGSAGWS